MGIDHISSQAQGGRLASTDGGCIERWEIRASTGAALSIQDNQRHPASEQESIIRNLGGDEVICTADEDLRTRLQELTEGKGVERAIDCVAGELGADVARNLAPGGTMLVYGALSSHRQTDPAKFTMPLFAPRLIYSTATVRGWWLPRWAPSQPLAEVRAATSDLLTMMSKGTLTPPATARYSLKDFQEAVRLADGEAGQEKVLLDFS
jgi:NADPH2:quinone reductase